MSRERDDPSQLSIKRAIERYLRRRRSDATEASVHTWKYRLKLFREWAQGIGIESVGELRPFDIDEYYDIRSGDVSPATLQGEMTTLKKWVEYLEQLGAVKDGLADAVRVPAVDDENLSDDTRLEEDAALQLIEFFRASETQRATRMHVVLELAWHTGARIGGMRALDLRDVHRDENYLEFKHRPDQGTPLKNKANGERPVAVPKATMDVIQEYIGGHRRDVHDDHGRQPLLASMRGRPDPNTIRVWMYQATEPCLHSPCPHGKERETCEWTDYDQASKCPSSRSPHQVRTGSITWQLNIGIPPEVVAERVNASIDVIERHYDKETPKERMERRRRPYIQRMEDNHESRQSE